jgi:8-oxo-dGTP pyrophosphatase MutT (NUDIX family)
LPAGAETIRDAATVVLVRRSADGPQVLMGRRGTGAVFMPDKFVFPGGAMDLADLALGDQAGPGMEPDSAERVALGTEPAVARALPLAGIRELWEETGLRLGRADDSAAKAQVPAPWRAFFAAGLRPHAGALRFIFRAVTPPGRTRRFDARFFLGDAADLADPADDFAGAGDELGELSWFGLEHARALPVAFITEVVLAEIAVLLAAPEAARRVPFFRHSAEGSHFELL